MGSSSSIVTPFRGMRYCTTGSSDLSALITPPYDIISEEMGRELLARHPHNFVRVELPCVGHGHAAALPRSPDGKEAESQYLRAATTLERWRRERVLVTEDRPSLYVLEQEFRLAEEVRRRRGVFALVRLPEEGDENYVLSHEGTLAAAKADRLKLMQACQAMTSPVMVIYEDKDSGLRQWLQEAPGLREAGPLSPASTPRPPDAAAVERDGVRDRLWVVADGDLGRRLAEVIGRGPLAIADGHHRFETAMAYRKQMRQAHPGAPAAAEFNYALMLIASAQDPALAILPTHRLISGLDPRGIADMKARMSQGFEVTEKPLRRGELMNDAWDAGFPCDRPVFGVYYGGESYCTLTAQEDVIATANSAVERLDVSVIHRHLLDPVIASCGGAECRITYVTTAREAAAAVARGQAEVAVLLRATRVEEVLAVARAGQRMPGKSTYFYPKAPAGLVLSSATAAPV